MNPSPYQQAMYDWIEHGTGHAVVDAVAGAGKTSTLIEGAKRLRTLNACCVAFNKVIADEIASRLQAIGSSLQASTMHSLGKRCLGKTRIEGHTYTKLCRTFIQGLTSARDGTERNAGGDRRETVAHPGQLRATHYDRTH